MPIKLEISNDLKKLLNTTAVNGLIPQVRTEFKKRGPLKVKQTMLQDMIQGISPVAGKGKWVKYSQSYKDVIQGKAAYRGKKGGGSIRYEAKDDPDLVSELNADFRQSQNPTKKISPVNLRLSGKLHKDLKVFTKGGVLSNFRLIVMFKNKLADIHNRLGAGKSKVIRRLLPSNKGEKFNREITKELINQLNLSAKAVVKRFNGQ